MLDVAGGSGAHSIGALRRWPRLRSIVLEIPPVCEVTREFAEAYGLSDRIVAQPADMWNDPFPPADLHFYSQIFHDWPPERCRVLARKSFDALPPGGRIIIHEMLLNQRKAGPPGVVGRNVAMLLWVQGQEFSARELSQILKDTGFVSIKSKHTFGHWGIVTGVKPR
jgi:acetylserotonin N-methyltransferase